MLFTILASCKSGTELIECNPKYGTHATSDNLGLFKKKEFATKRNVTNMEVLKEIQKIKEMDGRQNIMPSAILYYSFVTKKDTLYASSNLNYWFYKGTVRLYSSEVINEKTIEQLK